MTRAKRNSLDGEGIFRMAGKLEMWFPQSANASQRNANHSNGELVNPHTVPSCKDFTQTNKSSCRLARDEQL